VTGDQPAAAGLAAAARAVLAEWRDGACSWQSLKPLMHRLSAETETERGGDDPALMRELLAAVLEALDIPNPATAGDSEIWHQVLAARVLHATLAAKTALTHDLDRGPGYLAQTIAYLRDRLAENPPTGYQHWSTQATAPTTSPPAQA
jgi:hypothetical protein